MTTNLEIALAHAERGRLVFPLHPDTKKPMVPWQDWATKHPVTVRRTWTRDPLAGVAWRLPVDHVVVDIDRPDEWAIALPPAPSQRTTHGSHHLFRCPDGTVKQGPMLGGVADLKVGGKGYVRLYELDAFPDVPIPDLPQEVVSLRSANARPSQGPLATMTTRYDVLSFAGRLRRAGAEPDEIEAALLAALASGRLHDTVPPEEERRDWRPWDESDLASIAKDIGSKPIDDPTPIRIRRVRVERASDERSRRRDRGDRPEWAR